MLTSTFISSFPSLILLLLCEKHQQTWMERNGLQARGEIRKHFGKCFSKHWLKHWGSGFLCVLERRKSLWYTLLNDFPFFAHTMSFSHFSRSCGFANRCQACVELIFCPDIWMPRVQRLAMLLVRHHTASALAWWCAGGPLLGGIATMVLGPFPKPLLISFWGFTQCYRVWHLQAVFKTDQGKNEPVPI